MQGPVSERVAVTTMATSQGPLPLVTGLTVIALTGDRRMVAWDKSPAADIRDYVLYRSEGNVSDRHNMKQISMQMPGGFSIETYIDRDFDASKMFCASSGLGRQPLEPTAVIQHDRSINANKQMVPQAIRSSCVRRRKCRMRCGFRRSVGWRIDIVG